MNIRPIKTEKDYRTAMERLESIFHSKPSTPEGDELEVLGVLINNYERTHFPIDFPDPIEAITFRMEQMDHSNKDLA
ncbi:helix-turn-helix domain-containing protein [Parapedobacter sp. DT-150]|uniref:helix-turn-helix domain-containing protein n=1 Tax=Parapedobacter sp. DT-150 TaxID=3396162 RepID=UPI003F1A5F28